MYLSYKDIRDNAIKQELRSQYIIRYVPHDGYKIYNSRTKKFLKGRTDYHTLYSVNDYINELIDFRMRTDKRFK